MKKKIKNWSALVLTATFAAVIVLSLFFSIPSPGAAKLTDNVINQ